MRTTALRVTRQVAPRRFASTTPSEAASKVQAQTGAAAAKAQEQARAAATKGIAMLGKAGDSFARLASTTGGRTGRLMKAVSDAIPPTVQNAKIGWELAKLVFRGQKMTPPDLATFQSTFKSLANPSYIVELSRNAVQSVRSMGTKEAVFVGVLGAEVLGFFTVGEIIGRRKLIGYRGEPSHGH